MSTENATMEELRLKHSQRRALAYAISLGIVPQLAYGQISDLPATRFMREDLHLTPVGFATLVALTTLPQYLAPLFGYVRDRWSPLGLGDRGYFIVVPPIAMIGFLGIAALPFGYGVFLAGALLVVFAENALRAATWASGICIAKKNDIVSRFVGGNSFANGIFGAIMALAGGWAAEHIAYRLFLTLMGLMCGGFIAFGFFKPTSFAFPERQAEVKRRRLAADLGTLFKNRAFLGVFGFSVLLAFNPAGDTVIIYFLEDKLHGTTQSLGIYNCIGFVGGWCAALSFAWLRKRIPAWQLLFLTSAVSIFQFLPLYFAHHVATAYAVAFPVSVAGVLVNLPLTEIQIRNCSEGLEGISFALLAFSTGLVTCASNIWGASLFQRFGMVPVLWGTVISSVLMLPFIFLVPREATLNAAITEFDPVKVDPVQVEPEKLAVAG